MRAIACKLLRADGNMLAQQQALPAEELPPPGSTATAAMAAAEGSPDGGVSHEDLDALHPPPVPRQGAALEELNVDEADMLKVWWFAMWPV